MALLKMFSVGPGHLGFLRRRDGGGGKVLGAECPGGRRGLTLKAPSCAERELPASQPSAGSGFSSHVAPGPAGGAPPKAGQASLKA